VELFQRREVVVQVELLRQEPVREPAGLARALERRHHHVEERHDHDDGAGHHEQVGEPRRPARLHDVSSPRCRKSHSCSSVMAKMMRNSTSAIALAMPHMPKLNACWYISNPATLVASPGPPPVITMMRANDWSPAITWVMRTNSSVGRSSGNVMFQNIRQLPAPSSSAAS